MIDSDTIKLQARFKPLQKGYVTIFECTHDGQMPSVRRVAVTDKSFELDYEPHPEMDSRMKRMLEKRERDGLSNEEWHFCIPYMIRRDLGDICRKIIKNIEEGEY